MSVTPGRYEHYKGGEYDVYGVARHSETEELLVVYRPRYGEGELWVRPLAMFIESVRVDGDEVPRFKRIADAPDETI
ncbi:MAG: DUF1653 domain-containing protein [Halieaceae bacterium]|nr:DUF1653 domain-containing protein [Halieaceae bacterium]